MPWKVPVMQTTICWGSIRRIILDWQFGKLRHLEYIEP
jgi:hypothetical protein